MDSDEMAFTEFDHVMFEASPDAYGIQLVLKNLKGERWKLFVSCLCKDLVSVEHIRDLIMELCADDTGFRLPGLNVVIPESHRLVSVEVVKLAVVPF